jgi:hypothetical protein
LEELIQEFDFDFILIQETMTKSIDSSVWRKFERDFSYNWLWSLSVGQFGGILCGIKSSRFNVLSVVVGRFFVKSKVLDIKIQKEYCLIVVYGATQDEEKDDFLEAPSQICDGLNIPTIIGRILIFLDLLLRKTRVVELIDFHMILTISSVAMP